VRPVERLLKAEAALHRCVVSVSRSGDDLELEQVPLSGYSAGTSTSVTLGEISMPTHRPDWTIGGSNRLQRPFLRFGQFRCELSSAIAWPTSNQPSYRERRDRSSACLRITRQVVRSAEEAVQSVGSLLRDLFGKKVSGVERVSLNRVIAPRLPNRDRSRLLDVPGSHRSLGAPEYEDRARYSAPAHPIRLVMLAVEGRSRSIFFADGMSVGRLSKSLHIGRTDFRRKHGRRRAPSREGIINNGFSRGCVVCAT
jgi:hypothetical protein